MGNNKGNTDIEIAVNILKTGNDSFVESLSTNRVLDTQLRKTSLGQTPFAAILSCIDSRVPVETIFDIGIGDVFSFRSAGNFVTENEEYKTKALPENNNILGSLEFAKMSGVQFILVLGHSGCGAVKAAIAGDPTPCEQTNEMVGRLKSNFKEKHDVSKAIQENVINTIENIRNQSACLKDFEIRGGIYDISTGSVHFIPKEETDPK